MIKKGFFAVIGFIAILSSHQLAHAATNPLFCTDLKFRVRLGFVDYGPYHEVTALQKFLFATGYSTEFPDGYFGFSSRDALNKFQEANGLQVLGYADEATRAKIKELSCGGSNLPAASSEAKSGAATIAEALQNEVNRLIQMIASLTSPNSSSGIVVLPPSSSGKIAGIDFVSDKKLSIDGKITMKKGDTINFVGVPYNLASDYSRGFFFDRNFGDCSYTGWYLTCVADKLGVSQFYVELYQDFTTYRSSSIFVNVVQ